MKELVHTPFVHPTTPGVPRPSGAPRPVFNLLRSAFNLLRPLFSSPISPLISLQISIVNSPLL